MLVKAYRDFLSDITLLRSKIRFRIKDLLNEGLTRHPKKVVFGPNDNLWITTGKVGFVHYKMGRDEITVLVIAVNGDYNEVHLESLSTDDMNTIYIALHQNFCK